jgi:hypothetical protein
MFMLLSLNPAVLRQLACQKQAPKQHFGSQDNIFNKFSFPAGVQQSGHASIWEASGLRGDFSTKFNVALHPGPSAPLRCPDFLDLNQVHRGCLNLN